MSKHTASVILAENKITFVKQLLTVLPLSLSQEYAALNWVLWSVSTGLCPATTKFEVGVAGTTFFRPCARVKVRVTLNQCIRISTQNKLRTYHCMGLRHSSFLVSFSDRVWLAPVPRQCLNAFIIDMDFCHTGTWSGLLCWWACTSDAKHNRNNLA